MTSIRLKTNLSKSSTKYPHQSEGSTFLHANNLVWITNANLNKLRRGLSGKLKITEYDNVYKSELRFIFSNKILGELAFWKKLFSDLDILIDDLSKLEKENRARKEDLFQRVGSGAFHYDQNCKFLNNDYININVANIYTNDRKLIQSIREFANSNKKSFFDDPERFAKHIQKQFGLSQKPTVVRKENSGTHAHLNLDLPSLESKVDELIIKAKLFMYKDEQTCKKIKNLSNGGFRAAKHDNSGVMLQWHHRFQKPLYTLLVQYFRVALNPELSFERSFLEQLNFRPCGHCIGKVHR